MRKSFPHYQQLDEMDCGSTSLRMIAKYYGKEYSAEMLRQHCHITRNGVSMLGISEAAEYLGFRTLGVRITMEQLAHDASLPCILHWNQNHFVVCYKVKNTEVVAIVSILLTPLLRNYAIRKGSFCTVGSVPKCMGRIVVWLY